MGSHWMDISIPLRGGMIHWPDDPAVRVEKVRDMEKGDECTVSTLEMGSHTGTHMDAPVHFIRGGKGIDEMPMDQTVGPARVIEIQDAESIRVTELERHDIRSGERILFKTKNSECCWKSPGFVKDYVYLTLEGAQWLAERRIRMVGIDYLSVAGYKKEGAETHRALLRAGVWILEGLNLSGVRAGNYELVALPLRIEKGDGAPARAFLRRMKGP